MIRRHGGPLVLTLSVLAGTAEAQPAAAPISPPQSGVVRPGANVDPGIKVAPRRQAKLPTPVVHPPVRKGDTVVVPK